ncbi:hypothetical protein JMUB6875_70520 [Nocardia sp. JMUB6875]|uniref:hypothetical protein n=1 Tax=Nocardia sp. JMUB6875 TaxID=3158170 RepID=UPI0032E691F9
MIADTRSGRRIGWGAAGLVVAAAVVVAGAPTAGASVTNFQMTAQTYYVGSAYGMRAYTVEHAGQRYVAFYDNGQCIGGAKTWTAGEVEVYTPTADMTWIPTTAGRHVLTADDGESAKTITVDVLPAAPGSTPATGYKYPGCGALDRLIYTGSSSFGSN